MSRRPCSPTSLPSTQLPPIQLLPIRWLPIRFFPIRLLRLLGAVLASCALALASPASAAQAPAAALVAFDAYTAAVEHRLAVQHSAVKGFVAPAAAPGAPERIAPGVLLLEEVAEPHTAATSSSPAGAMLHHWRGTTFVPGASAADFEALLRDLPHYPEHFAPEVLRAATLQGHGDRLQTSMRVRQHHGLTVVLDTSYLTDFGRLDPQHGFSSSRSTRIAEIAAPGTPAEHPLSPADEHGFLWRLNTYWTYSEQDGGLLLQIETVSLSRAIPRGLGWVLRPYVESIPRDGLEFTLGAAARALRHPPRT